MSSIKVLRASIRKKQVYMIKSQLKKRKQREKNWH